MPPTIPPLEPSHGANIPQTYRSNEQMMQAMKGATMALGSMNRQMNLPGLTKIAMEFEKENDVMEQRQEMMDDAIDDAMDTGADEEGEEVVEQVLEEIGVDLNQAVSTLWWEFACSGSEFTDFGRSSGRRRRGCSSTRRPRQRLRRRRRLARTTTCRRGWIVFGGRRAGAREAGAVLWSWRVGAYRTLSGR